MTREEVIQGLQFTIDMFLLDPITGETYKEPRNDMDKTTIDACRGAIELLKQEPCEDAISRIETVKFLENHSNEFEDVKIRIAFQAASSLVNNSHNLPPVRPQPKVGRWVDGKCSSCGCGSMLGLCIENYCSSCGTKMVKPQESEVEE